MTTNGSRMPEIGHFNLRVADLDRAIGFYRQALGFHLTQPRRPDSRIIFMALADDSPLQMALELAPGAAPAASNTAGIDHVGIRYGSQDELAGAYRRLRDYGVELSLAQDHGAMISLYFLDPDGNQIEIYWERPEPEWPRVDGQLRMYSHDIDPESLFSSKV
ncbi:MAG TPA: VOC family protein [Thermomicrobiaceae bacterium]|nr:VOC family protein [Thermomicrobiaceae bacterium]